MATHPVTSRRRSTEDGASLVEYVFLLSLIVLVCLASLAYFGSSVNTRFSSTASTVDAIR